MTFLLIGHEYIEKREGNVLYGAITPGPVGKYIERARETEGEGEGEIERVRETERKEREGRDHTQIEIDREHKRELIRGTERFRVREKEIY